MSYRLNFPIRLFKRYYIQLSSHNKANNIAKEENNSPLFEENRNRKREFSIHYKAGASFKVTILYPLPC